MGWAHFNRAVLFAILGWLGTDGCRAATVPTPVTLVSLTIDTRVSGLHPNVTHGALDCGVVAQSGTWVSAHLADITDNYNARRWVLGPAHYYGQEALLEFPVVNRAFSGLLTFRAALPDVLLNDPATHARWAPAPTLLVACWLMLNGRPALWDHASTPLVVTAENFASVGQSPLAVATSEVAGSASVSLSAQLVAQGRYFVPEPVNLTANVSLGASAPYRSTARHAAASAGGGPSDSLPMLPATAAMAADLTAPAAGHQGADHAKAAMSPLASSPVQGIPGTKSGMQSASAAALWNIVVAIVEVIIQIILSLGGSVTAADQAELQDSVTLETIAAAAACTSAAITIIQQLPDLLDTAVPFGYVHDPVYAPLSGPPILIVKGPLAAPLSAPVPQPGRLTRQQLNAIIQGLPTDTSAPRTTSKLRALLGTIKPRD